MKTKQLKFVLMALSLAFGVGGFAVSAHATTTFLPKRPQQLLAVSHFSYTANAVDVNAIHHLGLRLAVAAKDGSITSTALAGNPTGFLSTVYPFFGSNANSQKYNLLDPRAVNAAFVLADTGTVTHSSTGAAYDGSTGWSDTHFTPSTDYSNNVNGISIWERTNRGVNTDVTMGSQNAGVGAYDFISVNTGTGFWTGAVAGGQAAQSLGLTSTKAFWSTSRVNPTQEVRVKDGVAFTTLSNALTSRPNQSIAIGAMHFIGGATQFAALNTTFAVIKSTNLGSTKELELYNIANAYVTALGR